MIGAAIVAAVQITLCAGTSFDVPKAVEFRIGKWSGLRGDGWSRGYARNDAPPDPEEAPVYSSDHRSVVLQRDGRAVAVHCDDGTPAYAVGCDVLIRTVFRSLR